MRLSGGKAGAIHPRLGHSRISVLGIGAFLLMSTASACTAQSAASGSVELYCSVEGGKLLSPGTTNDAVCSQIKREIDAALARQTKEVKSVASIGSADWIKVDVRVMRPGTASASVVQRIGGREIVHPEIAVDVMDKALGPKEINRLAAEVARAVAKTTNAKG